MRQSERLTVFPIRTKINRRGHLVLGGCDVTELVQEFGTPLYIYDEATLRAKIAEFIFEFGSRYTDMTILYAGKAFLHPALIKMVKEEGLGLDVVSGGEMSIARAARFPMKRAFFHGNNKSPDELENALKWKIGRIVVDNFRELDLLESLTGKMGIKQDILLRITPGVDPHTHRYTTTGTIDSKFGIPLPLREEAVKRAMAIKGINVLGLHFHIGSFIFETEPYVESIKFILNFAAEMKKKYGFELQELDTGGGFGVQYTVDAPAPAISTFAEALTSTVKTEAKRLKMELPRLIIEPGRSIVAQAGVAVYTVGTVKEIPGVRTYVAVNGGMGDNVCYALYGERYEAVAANRMQSQLNGKVTVCGKFCESGDILARDIEMPLMKAGDIMAMAAVGAYSIPESMNYNAFLRPPVVMVKDGQSRLIRRRETVADLTRCDIKE
jgi:diaminopimelate decarboxylase